MSRVDLPSFAKPPVVETVFGIQFELIPGFTNCHLGAFWAKLGGKSSWPFVSDAPLLKQEFERFGAERQWSRMDSLMIGLQSIPSSRMNVSNHAKNRMLQLQNGRLIYNWLGSTGSEYARYKNIRPEFDSLISQFQDFLVEEQLPPLQVNQWEVTYINHLPRGTVWKDVSDWGKIFAFDSVPPVEVNRCRLETFGGQWSYEIAPNRGRLHVAIHHGLTSPTGTELIVFNLTARGPVKEGEGAVETFDAGVDLGHEVVVLTFKDLVAKELLDYWEEQK